MRPITFASASRSSWGDWFLKRNIALSLTGFIQDSFRTDSDVASFVVKAAVLDQRESANKMIFVSPCLGHI